MCSLHHLTVFVYILCYLGLVFFAFTCLSTLWELSCCRFRVYLGGVNIGKLAPTGVSYRDDYVISYHVYMMTGFFHHPTSNVLKLTKPSWIDKKYACATRSSLPANRFHTETSGRFAFTWYRCEISYRGELTPGRLAPAWHFVVVSCKQM